MRVVRGAPAGDDVHASRAAHLAHGGRFTLQAPVADASALEALFRRSAVDVAVHLAPDASRTLARGERTTLTLLTDASDPNAGTTMQNYAVAALRDWEAARTGAVPPVAVEARSRMRFNPTLESVNLFVPGLIAVILTLVTSLMTALSLSREKERGTFEVLLVSPLHPWQVIVGKVLPYLVLALANVVTVLVAARFVFGVPFRGSLPLLLGASALFALVGLALGVLIAALTRSQLAAMLAALGGTMLPFTVLSGLIFPVASMPRPLQVVSHVVPARWFIDIVRGIMLKGVGVGVLWPQFTVLAAMLALFLVVAIRKTSTRLA